MLSIESFIEGDLANAIRIIVLVLGGFVVGAGGVILRERAMFYRRAGIAHASRAMMLLAIVNALVLTYISLVLLSKWDDVLTWRTILAIATFTLKGAFFYYLRAMGVDQERQLLYESHPVR